MEVKREAMTGGLGIDKVLSKDGESGKSLPKSASQIMQEQSGRAMPGMRKGISRRVYPLVSLNPYQGIWTIKVRVTEKGPMRSFTNARGQGNVFNVEFTDEEGTQIQATMFKEAADMFYEKLQLGKLYYISKGTLRAANKRFSTVSNDYEMNLNQNSEVEEIPELDDSPSKIPLVSYNFVKIDELGPYVNGRVLIDVVGILQSVNSTTSVRRKSNNEEIPKRDMTIADQSGKTVVLSIWNDLANVQGSQLLDMMNDSPIITVKFCRVSDYQGVSLSTTMKSTVLINADMPEVHALREWYDNVGRTSSLTPAGASLPSGTNTGMRQASSGERACIADVTQREVGDGKLAWFTTRACISYMKPDQNMWYMACTACNKKVIGEDADSYWCEGCQKKCETVGRRYILLAKTSDFSGEAWISVFNEQAELILGCSAERLADIKSQDPDGKEYENVLKNASWVPRMLGVSVVQQEYMGEKRQRITVRSVGPVDWAAECRLVLKNIAALR